MTYGLPKDFDGNVIEGFVLRTNADNSISWIPMVEENPDYQAYLASQENN